MCFSAQASFISAAVLATIGALALSKARSNSMRPFAATPLFFALQQALEGVVWVTLSTGETSSIVHNIGVYGFLFFASIFWPVWTPSMLYLIEQNKTRSKLLLASLITGSLLAIMAFMRFIHTGSTVDTIDHHIAYSFLALPTQYTEYIQLGMYFIATIGSLFISSVPRMWILGLIISIACGTSYLAYALAFGSVWCFFAALASIVVYYIVSITNDSKHHSMRLQQSLD